MQNYLLLIEDDPAIQRNNKKVLERMGYNIRQAFTLAEAREVIAGQTPAAIVLDIGLPDGSGLDFLRELRETSSVPVLVLTAMGTPEDIVRGLETGGDDYLAKPYDPAVFFMRIEALLRRAATIPEHIMIGGLRLEPALGKAYINGEDMGLAQKEYSLLMILAQHQDQPLGASYLFEKVWGSKMLENDVSLKNAIYRLRKKLEGSGYTITAEYGEGYVFERGI